MGNNNNHIHNNNNNNHIHNNNNNNHNHINNSHQCMFNKMDMDHNNLNNINNHNLLTKVLNLKVLNLKKHNKEVMFPKVQISHHKAMECKGGKKVFPLTFY